MNQHLQSILNFIQQDESLTAEEKNALIKSLKDADKELDITAFKLERTEKVKRTTAILLEETIEELEQKRKAVELQNRELEIESSLERVRTMAMSMSKPDDLMDICHVVYTELQLLGFNELRNAMINIYSDDKNSFLNYDYSARAGKTVTPIPYNFHPLVEKQVNITKNANDAFYEMSFAGEDLKDFRELRKKNGESDDPKLDEIESLHYYYYSIGTGSIGISTYSAITENKLELLKRFRNVFNLSYKRYTDIKKAEEQAREATIEAALEKIRSRSLAMHHSEELKDVIAILFEKLSDLKVLLGTVAIQLFDQKSGHSYFWVGNAIQDPQMVLMPYDKQMMLENTSLKDSWHAMAQGQDIVNKEYTREQKNKFFDYVFANNDFTQIPESAREVLTEMQSHVICLMVEKNSALFADSWNGQLYDKESLNVLKRASRVFEQAYIRFLDLQKAEAQSREAQIELALERVRAKTMAMHKSEELLDIIIIVSEQLQHLNIKFGNVSFGVNNMQYDLQLWMAVKGYPQAYHIRWTFLDNPGVTRLKEAQQQPERVFSDVLTQAENNEWLQHIFKCNPALDIFSEEARNSLLNTRGYARSIAIMKDIFLVMGNYAAVPYTDEENAILKRFANVFEQSYTRFLDLQKAEAQAREAQIEAALEKVRSTSLAMHHHNELEKVVTVLFDKLAELGLSFSGAGIFLFDQDKRSIRHWITGLNISVPTKNDLPYDEEFEKNKIIEDLWLAKEKGEPIFNKSYSKKVKDDFFQYTSKYNDASKIPEDVKKFVFEADSFTLTCAAERNCLMCLDSWSGPLTSDEDFEILKRFARVFEQAYVRFLDLQKAEAQAREAQIETALEKVRSRSLAMHHSDELEQVVVSLFDRLVELGLSFDGACIYIFEKEKRNINLWIATNHLSAPIKVDLPYDEEIKNNAINKDLWNAIENSEHIINRSYSGETKNDYFRYVAKYNESKVPESVRKLQIEADSWTVHLAAEKNSMIGYDSWSGLTISSEDFQILTKFAKVFEQAYTRFLDLQKAEAQAREAQIEASLERVRSRSSAMFKSSELAELMLTIFKSITSLGIPDEQLEVCYITTFDQVKPIGEIYLTNRIDGSFVPDSYTIPYNEEPLFKSIYEHWKNGDSFYVGHLEGQQLLDHFQYMRTHTALPALQSEDVITTQLKETFTHALYFSQGYLAIVTRQEVSSFHPIFKRFGNVLQQTYTRFLDLQKAEAQAREAQIELALERVRARTMAMQKSEELSDTAYILYQQFKELRQDPEQLTIGINNEQKRVIELWSTLHGNVMKQKIEVSIDEPLVTSKVYAAWKQQQKSLVIDLSGKELKDYNDYRNSLQSGIRVNNDRTEERRVINLAFFSKGQLSISSPEPLSEEGSQLLQRFAKVFEQTYTRFLDLQKSEAQARESQIQLAMERVRARTMAMQRSEELAEVATLLFQQVKALGVSQWVCGFSIWEIGDKEFTWYPGSADGVEILAPCKVPLTEHWAFIKMDESRKRGEEFYMYEKEGEQQEEHYRYMMTVPGMREQMQKILDAGLSIPTFQIDHIANFSHGNLVFITYEHFPEMHDIFKRFAKVFEQTYTRFLDLQKAEAQAREAHIETALEKVRSRTMAMQHSNELGEAALLLFQQAQTLGARSFACGFSIWGEEKKTATFWMAQESMIQPPFTANSTEDVFNDVYEAAQRGESLYVKAQEGKELEAHYQYMSTIPVFKVIMEKMEQAGLSVPVFQILHCAFFSQGFLLFITYEPVLEVWDVFKRFAKVFEQTYTRFLDLQKAEAQAQEARIEAALEKVRSRSLAVHKSDEFKEVISIVLEKLQELDIPVESASINIYVEGSKDTDVYACERNENGLDIRKVRLRYFDHPIANDLYNAHKNGLDFFVGTYGIEEKNSYYQYQFEHGDLKELPAEIKERILQTERYSLSMAPTKNSTIIINNFDGKALSETEISIQKRFAKVFEQAYVRFLDLKKAEAQAREAQIEASLERVRSKTMTMHNSQDVGNTVATMFDELVKLGIEKTIRCGIIIIEDTKQMEVWNASDKGEGKISLVIGRLDMTIHPALLRVYDAWKNKQPEIWYEFIGEDLKDYFRAINNSPEYPFQMDIASLPVRSFLLDFFFAEGAIFAFTHDAIATETTQIFKRFAAVFGQTYRRYLDLLKAEAQAKEAQIEVSLERVRAQTMAMNKSQDLQEVVSVIFRELDKLDLKTIRCGIGLINGQTRSVNVWSTTTTKEATEVNFSGNESMDIHPVLQGAFAGWEKQEDFYAVLEGESLTSYYDTQKGENYKLPDAAAGVMVSEKDRQYYFCTYFPAGGIYFFRHDPFSDELVKLIRRFASAFSLAYKRFEDLKQSEARALEVIKESSLDRVRAETASMRTTADLERITPLIWNELTTLGVPFVRCGVFIIDDEQQQIHTFLSTPDGKAIAAFHLPYNTSELLTQVVIHWRQNKIFKNYWDEAAFDDWTNTLVKKGIITTQDQYHTTSHPTNLHLHFLPFLQGMLYVGSNATLNEQEILLIQSLAGAFSTAYARYEDFNNLELAKEQIEKALVDLKLAQTQLVQSEKMASLGELTAGIAHEIQNPLNFVNNFSEVNTELIEEMKEEIDKGNLDDAKAIANDIKENEQKINHHGKRADSIVKGMLQHSRTSTATKEPTDINKLADEYLRLAYHGLRAKDKSFNATLKTDFDESIEKIDVIPQDIGRVLLNLYNNAFYAINEKMKTAGAGYEPTISISTKKLDDKITISVKDNGNGIPQKIVDKIFQPFFTTKPTGQGTGLGLSLTYDIVKAHSGEIKVESKDGEGTTFIVQLPFV